MKFEAITNNDFLASLIILVCAFILGKLAKFLLRIIDKNIFSKTGNTLDDRVISLLIGRVTGIFFIIGMQVVITEMQGRYENIREVAHYLHYVRNGFYIFIVFYVTNIILKITREIITWFLEEQLGASSGKVADTIGPLVDKVNTIIILFGAAIVLLDHFGVNIGSLLVSLGVGSLAIALAAQETLANMIAGIVLIVDRPFRVGDRIQLPSGEVGDVEELGLRSTKILNFDKNIIVIPNTELVKNKIVNYSYPTPLIRVLVDIPVTYENDLEKVKSLVLNIVKANKEILTDPPPQVYTVRFDAAAIALQLMCFTDDYNKKWDAETKFRDKFLDAFRENGISMPVQIPMVKFTNQLPE
ncbi:MAG: mechanosensitive ion channel family protein [Bacteroidota bacterium]